MQLLSDYIELNPEPRNAPIYPCGCCECIVNWSQNAVCNNDCSFSYHKMYISILLWGHWLHIVTLLQVQLFHTELLHHSYNLPISNSFNALLSIASESDVVIQPSSVSLSSPVRHISSQTTNHHHLSNLSNFSYIPSSSYCGTQYNTTLSVSSYVEMAKQPMDSNHVCPLDNATEWWFEHMNGTHRSDFE